MDSSLQSFGDIAMAQATAPTAPTALSSKLASGNIDKTSQDFEAMFMSQMMQPMFDTVTTDPMFGGGHAEEIMRSFLVQEYGKIAAKSGRLGIAAQVKSEMIKAQSAANSTSKSGDANAVAQ